MNTNLQLLDFTPLSLGIETKGGLFKKLIERNSTIPTKKSQIISTDSDNQACVSIEIYQGERALAKDNKLLGQFVLSGIPPAPQGIPQIEVTFDMDANSILHISAKELRSGKEQKVSIASSFNLSKEEVEEIVKDAELQAELDEKQRNLIEAKNNIENLIYISEKTIHKYRSHMTEELQSEFQDALCDCKECVDSENIYILTDRSEILNETLIKFCKTIQDMTDSVESEDDAVEGGIVRRES